MGPLRASRDRIGPSGCPAPGTPPGGARGSVGGWGPVGNYESIMGRWPVSMVAGAQQAQQGTNTRKNIIFPPISRDFLGWTVGFVLLTRISLHMSPYQGILVILPMLPTFLLVI